MKRILAILLCTLLTFTSTVFTCFADTANTEERYYSIPVEYSDHIGIIESLKVMIKGDHVYADAEMLAKALGYQVRISDEVVMIVNKDNDKLPQGFTKFYFNNTKVEHTIFVKALDTYKAPFASVKNDKGYWIPLEYSLLLLNSNCMIANNTLLIDNSEKKIADYYRDIQSNKNKYFFDFEKDFGYSGKDINRIGRYSHLVNQFNGLIDFEGTAWGSMFQSFILESSSYDKKYGENLALLLCGESQGELDAVKAKNDLYLNLLSEDGGLGSFLSQRSVYLDLETKAAYNTCEKILKEVRNGNTSASTYSKSYQILQKTLDKRTWFSKTGGNIMELQKKLSDVTSVLQVGSKVLEVVGYGSEFAKHDRFSLSSLKYFLDHSAETVEISKAMKTSMKQYSESLEKQVAEYTTKRFFEENVNDWVVDGLSIKKALGTQANAILFAWDISSNVIPFISNGLSSADKFEQALYAMVFQGNTEHNYIASRNALFNRPEDITAERLYNLSQYCYIYLKSCYVTRNAALGSLEGKSGAVKKKLSLY